MRLALLALFMCGCAATDCRTANWYDLGFRDAIFALQPQDNVYAAQCQNIDTARYVQGWREGKYEADSRRAESHD